MLVLYCKRMKILRYIVMVLGLVGMVLTMPARLDSVFALIFLFFVLMFIGSFWIASSDQPVEPPAAPKL